MKENETELEGWFTSWMLEIHCKELNILSFLIKVMVEKKTEKRTKGI